MRVFRLEVTGAVHDNRRRGALLGPGKVILVLGKRQVAWLRPVGRREALDDQRRIADDFTPDQFGDFSSGIWHKRLSQISAATIDAIGANSISSLEAGADSRNRSRQRQLALIFVAKEKCAN